MGRERRKWEHTLPRFPFHCYTNPGYARHPHPCTGYARLCASTGAGVPAVQSTTYVNTDVSRATTVPAAVAPVSTRVPQPGQGA
jgi:hypothetical protein